MNIIGCEVWEVIQNIGLRHSGCEVLQDIVYRDSHAADTRLAAALIGLNGDDISIVDHNNGLSYVSVIQGDKLGNQIIGWSSLT